MVNHFLKLKSKVFFYFIKLVTEIFRTLLSGNMTKCFVFINFWNSSLGLIGILLVQIFKTEK